MRIHSLIDTHPRKKGRRVGRGISAGQGKTAGRGTKGQKARTGANSNIPRDFDGGATSAIGRLPKLKGFKSHRAKPVTLNMARLAAAFPEGGTVGAIDLVERGLIDAGELKLGVKVVGSSRPLSVTVTLDPADDRLRLSKRLQSAK